MGDGNFGFYGNGLDGYVHYRQGVSDARESMNSGSSENADSENDAYEDEEEDADNPNLPAEINQNRPEAELREPPLYPYKKEHFGCTATFLIVFFILSVLGLISIIYDLLTT